MTAEDPKITVIIYKDGESTGKTKEIDLSVPENQEKLQESLKQQDGEFD